MKLCEIFNKEAQVKKLKEMNNSGNYDINVPYFKHLNSVALNLRAIKNIEKFYRSKHNKSGLVERKNKEILLDYQTERTTVDELEDSKLKVIPMESKNYSVIGGRLIGVGNVILEKSVRTNEVVVSGGLHIQGTLSSEKIFVEGNLNIDEKLMAKDVLCEGNIIADEIHCETLIAEGRTVYVRSSESVIHKISCKNLFVCEGVKLNMDNVNARVYTI